MSELYSGPTTEFIELAGTNEIAERVTEAFVAHFGYRPPASEVRSWRASLRALANAVDRAGLHDHGIMIEYRLPHNSRRLDALLTGLDDEGRPRTVVVELKQWDDAQPSTVPECVTVRYGAKLKDTLHPSAQVRQYVEYLTDTHSAFTCDDDDGGRLRADGCAFLHDMRDDPTSELLAPHHQDLLTVFPLFPGERTSDLIDWLCERLAGGHGRPLLARVREGSYAPSRKLLEHTAAMIRQEPTYTLLDEQMVVYNDVSSKVAHAVETGEQVAFLVQGGPGTGKSVLALNLVADLSAEGRVVHHATGSAAFTSTVRKKVGTKAAKQFMYFNSYLNSEPIELDVLVCDEAHRIRKHSWDRWTKRKADDPQRPQIDDLLDVAAVTVFFIDDHQAVRREEIGRSQVIREAALARGIEVREHELPVQFRCGGSDGFIEWVDHTLEVRPTPTRLWEGDPVFDFDVVDSPEELEALIRSKDGQPLGDDGRRMTARLVAGYCWPWSNPDEDGHLVRDVNVGEWRMPWNAKPEATGLAQGIPKSHLWATEPGGIDQVGCIYTAQGFEFDYVGVVWGGDLVYRAAEGGWVARKEHSRDGGLTRGTSEEELLIKLKQVYRVLLTRGLQGCYVYFVDDETRRFIESRIDSFAMRVAAEGGSHYAR